MIFGAGHVGRCVADLAKGIGFRVTVVDDRIKYANRDRFPNADILVVDSWESVFNQIQVNDSSYLLIVTRGHQYDLVCLRYALTTPAKYIGLLGSRRKIQLFRETLEKEGVIPSQLVRLHAPVGIAIGAETPEEIAVSIAAQLVAARRSNLAAKIQL